MDALPNLVANASHGGNSSENGLPDGLLDTLSPFLGFQLNPLMKLFMILHKIIEKYLGIDPTYIMISVGVVWATNKVGTQLYTTFDALFWKYFAASIEVSSNDDIHAHLMGFFATQRWMAISRFLIAETASKGVWDEKDDDLATIQVSPDGYLNFSHQAAKAAPRFTPAWGVHSFWFRRRCFMLRRKRDTLFNSGAGAQGMPQYKDNETLVLSCFGRSPESIKQLLQYAKEQYYIDHRTRTIVKRPLHQGHIFGHRSSWRTAVKRPFRPMKTVVLDDNRKDTTLSDMNLYLDPKTSEWYAYRGIPLRRGYLFHGPPGTGKTSFSFALAGVFGLDIHVISLQDPALTDEDLLALFTSLPRRCIVLLEDIDTAGLKRPGDAPAGATSSSLSDDDENKSEKNEQGEAEKKESRQHKRKDGRKGSDLARKLKGHGNNDSSGGGISLAGLLNAIDGVASHEGRVLIMTTNKPETLDEALIRPGRVDQQVEFTNATSNQARELFLRMYESEDSATSELPKLAMEFSSHIPDSMFSPAQLQGYLLMHQNTPRKALEGVEAWMRKTRQQ